MSIFSEKLKCYTQENKINMYSLAKNCGIDRASLYQMINGKRKPNSAVFQQLLENIPLTPGETEELIQAYEMLVTGEGNYRRRKKIEEIIRSLEDISPFTEALILPVYGHSCTVEGAGTAIYGEPEVNRTVRAMLELEAQRGGRIGIIAQPEYRFLFDSIVSLKTAAPALEITHIICLETDVRSEENRYNLNCVHTVLRSSMVHPNYKPMFYYDSVDSHFGKMSLLPYLILTDACAMQISRDLRYGLFFRDREQIGLLNRRLVEMERECRPMVHPMQTMFDMISLYGEEYKTTQPVYASSFDPCIMPFVDRELLRGFLNRQIPEFDGFVELAAAYAENLRRQFHEKPFFCMTQLEGLEQFLATGYLHEFPLGFYDRPLDLAAQKLVLERMITGVEEDWCRIRFYRPGRLFVNFDGEVVALDDGSVFVQYNGQMEAYAYQFSEKSISFAFYDYLESLSESRHVMSKEETLQVLRAAAVRL